MRLILSQKIRDKLEDKHGVTEQEIQECFWNRDRTSLIDTREDHFSDPPTEWFIAETNYGRKLVIVYIPRAENIYIRSAFEPTTGRLGLYMANSVALSDDFEEGPTGE